MRLWKENVNDQNIGKVHTGIQKALALAPFFVSLEVVLEVLIPYMMANIIDIGITQGNMPYILKVGIMLVFMAMLSLLFGALSGKFAARAAAGFAKNLRKDMFYNIQGFSFPTSTVFPQPAW